MFDFISYTADNAQLFMLLLVRGSGLFMTAPILGHRSIPRSAKTGMVILFALIAMPAAQGVVLPESISLLGLTGLLLRELMVGVLIGFFFALIIKAAEMAGAMTGFQIGLIIAQAFDQNAGGQVSIIGRFWIVLASLIFMAINGHHHVIRAFHESIQMIPPGQMVVQGGTAVMLIKYTAYVFVLAIKIASPVIITLILADVAMGALSKTMPTMNIFIVGFPLKVGLGLMVVAMALPILSYVLQKSTTYLNESVRELMLSMGGA